MKKQTDVPDRLEKISKCKDDYAELVNMNNLQQEENRDTSRQIRKSKLIPKKKTALNPYKYWD